MLKPYGGNDREALSLRVECLLVHLVRSPKESFIICIKFPHVYF